MGGAIRLRRDASGRVDLSAQRRPRFETVLRALQLWDLFARMPRRTQEHFWRHKSPDPVLEFDRTFPSGREHREFRRALELRFHAATIEVDGASINARDFVAVVTGCMLVVRGTRTFKMPEEVVRFVRDAGPNLERAFAEHCNRAFAALDYSLREGLAARSRLDVRLYTAAFSIEELGNRKIQPRVTVGSVAPQVRSIRLDSQSRPMFRIGKAAPIEGISWLSWTREQLGYGDAGQQFPLYVQSHALRQLHQRVNFEPMAPYVEAWLAASLDEPRIVDRHGGDLIVEYRVQHYRLGYLVVTPLNDLVAVRTFKFLTMSNTPEARMLERQLRLTRREVDWLGLHELGAFTETDLSGDPLLRELLEKCGCGHLFSLRDEDFAPRPKADQVRRYLGLAA